MLEYFCKAGRESLDYTVDFYRFLVGRESITAASAIITAPVVTDPDATLTITRVGYTKASQFVFSQHCKSLRGLKVSEERIAAIPHWQVADCYTAEERAVLAYADCLSLQAGRTPEPVFAALKAFLSDHEILELTYITCMYDMHAVMSRALRTEWDDRDDPIVEVAAPKDFSGADFLDIGRRP